MASARGMSCCGLAEIAGISYGTPEEAMRTIVLYSSHNEYRIQPVMIFTGASTTKTPPAYSEKFKALIEKEKLGDVTVIEASAKNPNSHNYITTYVWRTNKKNLKAWYTGAKKKAPRVVN
jgi:hypothetical protein